MQADVADLRDSLEPVTAPSEALHAAYRATRTNFRDVLAELRAALQKLDKGKTGRSLAVEHLLALEDEHLQPWLDDTAMFFDGKTACRRTQAWQFGTVSPLPKDLEQFRPVTLLEPIYKCCMATMSGKLLLLLHDWQLLDLAQYGFVIDGSCIEPLTVVNRMYEHALANGHELHMAYLDATSAFDSIPHVALDAAMHRLCAPDDFTAWLRSVLTGHRRVASTAYSVDADDLACTLNGGTP